MGRSDWLADQSGYAVPLTSDVLHRALHWGAVAVIAAVCGWAAWQQEVSPTLYPPGLLGWVTVVALAGFAWCVADAVRNNPRRTALRWWVGLGLVLGLVQVIGRFPAVDHDLTDPLTILGASAYGVAGFAFAQRIGLVVAALSTVTFIAARWNYLDNVLVVLTAATIFTGGASSALVIDRLRRCAGDVETAVTRAWREREQASREQAAAEAQQEWDGLVHDKVLGALLLAGRSKSAIERDAARELAQDAIDALDGDDPRRASAGLVDPRAEVSDPAYEVDLLAHATRTAARWGLGLRWTGPGTTGHIRADRGVALRDATEQAIVNVARHAGVASVAVELRRHPHEVVARVSDLGVGFDVGTDRGRHRGIAQGIEGRASRVGGAALVESAPGAGTTVTIRMPVAHSSGAVGSGVSGSSLGPAESATVTWRDRSFLPVYRMAALSLSAQTLAALRLTEQFRSLAVLVGCLLVVIGAFLIIAFAPLRHRRWSVAASLVASTVAFVSTLNIVDPARGGWSYWFVGAMTAVIAGSGFRWGPVWSSVLLLSVVGGIPAAHLVRLGTVAPGPLADTSLQVVAFFVAATAVRRSLDNASASIAAAGIASGQARLLVATAEETRSVARARIHELGYAVNDQLRLVAGPSPLSEADRRECLALESRARDVLVAGPMLTPKLVAAVARCRADGIRVVLSADRGETGGIAVFVAYLLDALSGAGPGAVVRALWRPDGRGRLGSISVVGDMPSGDLQSGGQSPSEVRPDAASGAVVVVEVTHDDESLLITFTQRVDISAEREARRNG